MPRSVVLPFGVALLSAVVVAAIVVNTNRQAVLLSLPSATGSSTVEPQVLTSGDAIVSRKPDLAILAAGLESQQATASAAQGDLATKATQLIARVKALGVPDKELNTTGYWVGPVYGNNGQTVSAYRATEQLQVKWHNVDTVGKALDAIGQEGGATNISVSFGLADLNAAQAEARSLAIADARSKAQAMVTAAGVRLGQVIRVSDLSSASRPSTPISYAGAALGTPTQVPVGELDVQAVVEVDFAIA